VERQPRPITPPTSHNVSGDAAVGGVIRTPALAMATSHTPLSYSSFAPLALAATALGVTRFAAASPPSAGVAWLDPRDSSGRVLPRRRARYILCVAVFSECKIVLHPAGQQSALSSRFATSVGAPSSFLRTDYIQQIVLVTGYLTRNKHLHRISGTWRDSFLFLLYALADVALPSDTWLKMYHHVCENILASTSRRFRSLGIVDVAIFFDTWFSRCTCMVC
jgi:hypothetical protein